MVLEKDDMVAQVLIIQYDIVTEVCHMVVNKSCGRLKRINLMPRPQIAKLELSTWKLDL